MEPTLSIQLVNFAEQPEPGWADLFDRAGAADACGVDRVAVSDHIAFGDGMEAYGVPDLGGIAGGRQPTSADGHWLEPLTVLSFVAARTERVRLQTGILLAALRRPAVLAKTVATLDVLSGGRVDLGVGVGWQREEYEVVGLSFERRGTLLDHTLEVCRALWTEDVAELRSPHLSFSGIHARPKPLAPGGVPVWVSGRSHDRVLARVARFGEGWIPWADDADDPVPAIGRLTHAWEQAGRVGRPGVQARVRPVAGANGSIDPEATMADVAARTEAGVTDFQLMVRLRGGYDQCCDRLGPLVEAFRAAVGRS